MQTGRKAAHRQTGRQRQLTDRESRQAGRDSRHTDEQRQQTGRQTSRETER